MDLGLRGKIIFVTGGAKGIGAAISRSCAREGATPVIFDRDQEAASQIQRELSQSGFPSETVVIDLANTDLLQSTVRKLSDKLGQVDGLVNNAGTNDGVGLQKGSPEQFRASLQSNLLHYYAMTQATLPMIKQCAGNIVNISSKVAVTGQGGTSGYAAAKGAILGLTVEWAIELAAFGVRVNAVIPAEVWTPQYETWVKRFPNPENVLRDITSAVPLGARFTDADEVAATATFLLSPQSASINGRHLFVDGGYVHLDRSVTRRA